MTNKNFTSRGWIIDAINFIQEQIALASHCQELIHYYDSEIKKEYPSEQVDDLVLKKGIQQDLLDSANTGRRSMMKEIEIAFEGNHLHRCQLKHAIAAYQFVTEVVSAKPSRYEQSANLEVIQSNAYENMIGVLSLFTNQEEFVTCGRCLDDMLSGK